MRPGPTTKGRKSGEPRSLPLIYGTAGDSYVIIASKGGLPSHPVWFLNLEAEPNEQRGKHGAREKQRGTDGDQTGTALHDSSTSLFEQLA